MNRNALLIFCPGNRAEAEQLHEILLAQLNEAGIMLSLAAADELGKQAPSTIIAMIGSDGSSPWDESNIAERMVELSTAIVPVLCVASHEIEIEIPAPVRARATPVFEVSPDDAGAVARLIFAVSRLEATNAILPEAVARSLYESTILFYEQNAQKFIQLHEEEIPKTQMAQIFSFVSHVARRRRPAEKARILDAGCGPGHHARFFTRCGFTAVGMDASSRFVQHATATSTGDCLFVQGDMREVGSLFSPDYRFDGVWANASFLHINRQAIGRVLDQVRGILRRGGVLGVSFQLGMSTVQREGRFFERYESDELRRMLGHHGFHIVDDMEDRYTKSTTGRTRIKRWINFIAVSE